MAEKHAFEIEIFILSKGFRAQISRRSAQKWRFQHSVCGHSGRADFFNRIGRLLSFKQGSIRPNAAPEIYLYGRANSVSPYLLQPVLPKAGFNVSATLSPSSRGNAMAALPDDPTPALLSRLNQNINALGSAIEEIGIWIDQRGSTETYHRINEHLETLSENSDAIAELLVDLIVRWVPESDADAQE
jgi:hypothetical protein